MERSRLGDTWERTNNLFCQGLDWQPSLFSRSIIYCDQRRLLFFGVHIRLLTSSLWVSSPIWVSEASLSRMGEQAAKPHIPSLACSSDRLSSLAQIEELARRLGSRYMGKTFLLSGTWLTAFFVYFPSVITVAYACQ